MAYPYATTKTTQTSGTTIQASSMPSHATNDLLLACVTSDTGATAITQSGGADWTIIGTQQSNDSHRMTWHYKVATSGSETAPTFNVANANATCVMVTVKDADTSTPIRASARADFATYTSGLGASGTLSATANDLLIHSWCVDGGRWLRCKASDLNMLARTQSPDAVGASPSTTTIIGYKNAYSTGTTSAVTAYATSASDGGTCWTLCIANKSGGSIAPDCSSGVSLLNWHGDFGAQHDAWGTGAAPNGIVATLNGLSTGSGIAAISQTSSAYCLLSTLGAPTQIAMADNGVWAGNVGTLNSTWDLTSTVYYVHYSVPYSSSAVGAQGLAVMFIDGSGNWVAYQLANGIALQSVRERVGIVDLATSTKLGESGTPPTLSNITKRAILLHKISASTINVIVKNEMKLGTTTVYGGGAHRPHNWKMLQELLYSWELYNVAALQRSKQVGLSSNIQIGDGGTHSLYWDSSAGSMEFPIARDTTNPIDAQEWNGAANALNVTLYPGASDTLNLSAGSMVASVQQDLNVHASASPSASASMSGQTLIGFEYTDNAGLSLANVTLKQSPKATFGSTTTRTETNWSISETTSSDAPVAITGNGMTLSGCTISCVRDTGANASYHLSLGSGVTSLTLNSNTFSGTPGTDKIYSALASGTLAITWDGLGTSIANSDVTFVGGSTAVANVVAPQVYQSVTVSGFTAGSRIQIYDTTSSTELFNGTASAGNTVVSGTTATWTDPAAATASRAIRVRITYVSGATAKLFHELSGLTCGTTSGTETVTYPDTPEADTTYNDNGLNGPAIYATSGITFVDSGSADRVDCNIAGGSVTYATIYACFVYWMNTATGIADNFTYISAPDTANYLFTAMKIRNTSATDLMVTGGYGRNATTLLSKDIIDTAGSTGNIFLAPDHVAPYALSSGITAGDISNIASSTASQVLTSAQSTPIYADVRKVKGTAVTGSGTTIDPWGP